MKASRFIVRALGLVVAVGCMLPPPVFACPVCYGAPASPMQQGMNMGIAFMLVVTGVVLSGFIGFIIYLVRRARHFGGETQTQNASLDIEWMDGKEKVR